MKKNRLFIWVVLVFQVFSGQIAAQSANHQYGDNFNGWLMYFGSHKVSDKWGLHLEAQWRRSEFLSHSQQLLLRGGVNYHFSPQAVATVGYGFIETYPYGEFPVAAAYPEHRIWEQLQLKSQLNAFEMITRFRLEQRYSKLPVANNAGIYTPGDAVYTNRARLMNRFSLPFKGKVIADKSFYLSAYDEILINFGKNVRANIFDQNRLYGAIGYKIPKAGRLELGLLSQIIQKPDGVKIERNTTFQLGFSSNIDFYKKSN